MGNWWSFLKKTEYPDYWKRYDALFSGFRYSNGIKENRFVVFDTETSGFDFNKDRVLSIGAVEISNHEINIANSLELYLDQMRFNEDTVEIHGILRNERLETLTEDAAIEVFLDFIGNSILVAHHSHFDINMINRILRRKGLPKLKNKFLDTVNLYKATRIKSNFITNDTYTLDEIADNYALDVTDRHTAAGDALLTAIIFLRTTTLLFKRRQFSLKELFKL